MRSSRTSWKVRSENLNQRIRFKNCIGRFARRPAIEIAWPLPSYPFHCLGPPGKCPSRTTVEVTGR